MDHVPELSDEMDIKLKTETYMKVERKGWSIFSAINVIPNFSMPVFSRYLTLMLLFYVNIPVALMFALTIVKLSPKEIIWEIFELMKRQQLGEVNARRGVKKVRKEGTRNSFNLQKKRLREMEAGGYPVLILLVAQLLLKKRD